MSFSIFSVDLIACVALQTGNVVTASYRQVGPQETTYSYSVLYQAAPSGDTGRNPLYAPAVKTLAQWVQDAAAGPPDSPCNKAAPQTQLASAVTYLQSVVQAL